MFRTMLLNGVLATVHSFDGLANVLSLTLPTERGGGILTAMILDALQALTKTDPFPYTTPSADLTHSCTPSPSPTALANCPQPNSIPETQKCLGNEPCNTGLNLTPEPRPQLPEQSKNTSAVSVSG